jgi:hypothetical protein
MYKKNTKTTDKMPGSEQFEIALTTGETSIYGRWLVLNLSTGRRDDCVVAQHIKSGQEVIIWRQYLDRIELVTIKEEQRKFEKFEDAYNHFQKLAKMEASES